MRMKGGINKRTLTIRVFLSQKAWCPGRDSNPQGMLRQQHSPDDSDSASPVFTVPPAGARNKKAQSIDWAFAV